MSARTGQSKLRFSEKLPTIAGRDFDNLLLIFDRKLLKFSPEFAKWSAKFKHSYGVTSGEELKSLASFPQHVQKLSKIALEIPARKMTVIAVGGGSVGDFAGFFASVYKRGVRIVQVPSTWLAAVDSAHGGKTALNVGGTKNQIGTFYPASEVWLVRSLLKTQPKARIDDALGELAKIALIDGGSWVRKIQQAGSGVIDPWTYLRPAIVSKLKVVSRDPREIKGDRQVLNLGHTFGHALEAASGLSHGRSVTEGLFFALDMSVALGTLNSREEARARDLLVRGFGLVPSREVARRSLTRKKLTELLLKDKKRSGNWEVTFIALRAVGRTSRLPVPITRLAEQAVKLGWVKG